MDTNLLTMTFGERLAKARRIAGFTQQQLADQLGVGRKMVLAYEADARAPRRATVLAWSYVTDVPLSWLETGEISGDSGGATGRYTDPMQAKFEFFADAA